MPNHHHSPTAIAYARSLLELANQQQRAEEVARELDGLREVLDSVPVSRAFLADPGIGIRERDEVLTRTFGKALSPLVMNFLGVLNHRRRLKILPEILSAYDSLLGEHLGRVEVDVTVARRLSPDELEQVRQRVGQALKKEAVAYQYVDASIIGGLVLRVGDRLIDGSVRYQLEAMRQRLLAAPAILKQQRM